MSKLKSDDSLVHHLAECVDKLMPVALQITLEKNKEPTFKNVLDVVATCCYEWYSALTATGTFAQLSTGWLYVRHTNKIITDSSTLDDAVLCSLRSRSLSSFSGGVQLSELSNYITAAFGFPKPLTPDEISKMVQCSINTLTVWGKVKDNNGRYKLAEELRNADTAHTAAIIDLTGSTESLPTENDVVSRADIFDQNGGLTAPSGNSSESGTLKECSDVVVTVSAGRTSGLQFSLKSPASKVIPHNRIPGSPVSSDVIHSDEETSEVCDRRKKRRAEHDAKTRFFKPFLYAHDLYKLYVIFIGGRESGGRRIDMGPGHVRTLLEDNKLVYFNVYVPLGSRSAFVEVKQVEDGLNVIEKLHNRYHRNAHGEFKAVVEWSRPTGRDMDEARNLSRRRQRRSRSSSAHRPRHSRSVSKSRCAKSRSPSWTREARQDPRWPYS